MDKFENQPFKRAKPDAINELQRVIDAQVALKGWEEKDFSLNGKDASVVGVMHIPETVDVYIEKMEEKIKNSAVILLEGGAGTLTTSIDAFPSTVGTSPTETSFEEALYPSKQQVEAFRETLKRMAAQGVELSTPPDKLNDSEIRREIVKYQDKLEDFFEKVRHLAALHGKPIAFSDPLDSIRRKYQEGKDAYIREHGNAGGYVTPPADELIIQDALFYGGASIAAATGFAAISRKRKSMTRRSFIKIAGAGAAAGAVGGLSKLAEKIEIASLSAQGDMGRSTNPLGAFRYNWVKDYREIIAGLSMQRLADTYKDTQGQITAIFGGKHRESIVHYASSSVETPLRLRAYPHRNEYDEPTLSVYEFDKARHVWKEKSKESLLRNNN